MKIRNLLENKNILMIVMAFIFNIAVTTITFSDDTESSILLSPFKNALPKKVIEVLNITAPEIIEPVETFDTSSYRIEGLVWGAYKPKVVINSEIYGVGDKLGDAEITKINRDGVTVNLDDKDYTIPAPTIDLGKGFANTGVDFRNGDVVSTKNN